RKGVPRPKPRVPLPPLAAEEVSIGLSAAVLAMRADEPVVAVLPAAGPGDAALPGGPFALREHIGLESGLRALVQRQTGLELAFAQQLCTLGDRGPWRDAAHPMTPVVISVCYLALLGPGHCSGRGAVAWQSWYDFLPGAEW